jgi:hypothetical protein
MEIKDTTLAGFVSGLVGAIIGLILSLVLKWLGLTDRVFHDLAQVLILFKLSPGILDLVIGTLAHLEIGGLSGAIFAHFISATSRNYIIIKGIIYGVTLWLLFLGLGNYFRMPVFCNMPPMAALLLWIGSAIYGLIMPFTLSKLSK